MDEKTIFTASAVEDVGSSHAVDEDVGSHAVDENVGSSHAVDEDVDSHAVDEDVGSHAVDEDVDSHAVDEDVGSSHAVDEDVGSSHAFDNDKCVDFITKKGTFRHKLSDLDKINRLLSEHLNTDETREPLVCLDFHGVADVYKPREPIPTKLPVVIISYIGGNPETKKHTIDVIKTRILSDNPNNVKLGIIVYNKHHMPICGTKGWILSLIANIVKKKFHFVDDDMKNIQCAKHTKIKAIITHFITKAPSESKLQKLKPEQRKPLPRQAMDELLKKLDEGKI
jgi:hypothetical protein